MVRVVLIVDDQRDILKLLRATLESLKNPEIRIFEAPSGEEALLESSRNKIDLLVTDYRLPGITGVELMHKVRARHPEARGILITGMTDRKIRDDMLNAGASAIFDKPIPLADFLDAVERGLGLVRTIFPPETTNEKSDLERSISNAGSTPAREQEEKWRSFPSVSVGSGTQPNAGCRRIVETLSTIISFP